MRDGTLAAEALILGTDLPESVSRDEIKRPERPKRERGQGGLPPESPASLTEVTLSKRFAWPRKTASLFMRSTNFLKLARAMAKSSGAKRRCLFMRWTPTVIQARKESAQVGW